MILSIALGGALGAVLRYLLIYRLMPFLGLATYYGTFLVNSLGSFLMGLAMIILIEKLGPELRSLIIIGFLGSFTTFSTYSADVVRLIEIGDWLTAGVYGALSIAIGLIGFIAGAALASLLATKGIL